MKPLIAALSLVWLLCVPAVSMAGDHAVASETIWPTQNDVANVAGDGKKFLENQWAKPIGALSPNNYTLSGLTVPATSVSLAINVASGTAYIAGRHITITVATSVTAAASITNYLFLKLTRDGGSLVTGVSLEVNTTSVPPTDSIYLATLTAGASTITATADKRVLPSTITILSGSGNWLVPAGITRIYVELFGNGGGGGGGGGDSGSGTAGAAGGNVSFDAFTAFGGGGGRLGRGVAGAGVQGASHGGGSGGSIIVSGGGDPGGAGGGGSLSRDGGGDGGNGGYVAGNMAVTPGALMAYSIGIAGIGGTGGGGTNAGAAGQSTVGGTIVIHYY